MYFGGRLSMPEFVFFARKQPFGRFTRGKSVQIGISAYRKGWSEDFLKDVLIHEMIHQYVMNVCGDADMRLFIMDYNSTM